MKEDRVSAKQELKAVANALSHIGLTMDDLWSTTPCAPINPETEVRCLHCVDNKFMGYVVNKESGKCRWDTHLPQEGSAGLRLILGPDQGSPLFSAFQYLVFHNANIGLIRDELWLGQE